MKLFFRISILAFIYSCNKSGDNPIPPQPLPPIDSSRPASHFNFGQLIFLTDTFRVYDASSGKLQIYTGPYGNLAGAYINNTTIDSDLVYQPSPDGLLALNANTGHVQYIKYFAYGHGGVSTCFPIIEGNYMYQCFYNSTGSGLYCLNKRTADTIWQTHVYLGSDVNLDWFPTTDQTSKNIIVAGVYGPASFSKATGQLVWQNTSSTEYALFDAWPKVCTETRVLFFSRKKHLMYAFDASNGNFLWKVDFTYLGTNISMRPYFYNNKVYVSIQYGSDLRHGVAITSFDINTGQVIDQYKYPLSINSVAYYDRYYYIYEDTTLTGQPIRISKHQLSDGSPLWATTISGNYNDGMVATPAFIYYTSAEKSDGSGTKTMNILDQASGNLLRQFPVYTDISFTPAVRDSTGQVYYQRRY